MAATSSAVIGVPSWNLTPWRILNVHTLPSAFGFQLSASRGWSFSLLSDHDRNSAVCDMMPRPPSSATLIGSISVAGPGDMPSFSVPPARTVTSLPPASTAVPPPPALVLVFLPVPHALARNPTAESDIPITVPRRMKSRRLRCPELYLVDEVVLEFAALRADLVDPAVRLVAAHVSSSVGVSALAPAYSRYLQAFCRWTSVPEAERRPYRRA